MPDNFIYKNINLNDEERIVKVVRQARWLIIFKLSPAIILIILPFFFLFPLFTWGQKGIIIFFSVIILGLLWLARLLTIWYFKVLVITNQRIIDIDQQKTFRRLVSDFGLEKIQDAFYRIGGLIQTLTRVGDIEIIINDGKTKIEFKNIFRPQKIQQLILSLRLENSNIQPTETELSAQELVRLIKKIKAGIGQEAFEKIINDKKIKA